MSRNHLGAQECLVTVFCLALTMLTAPSAAQDRGEAFSNQSVNVVTGALLGENRGWVWIRPPNEPTWRKLIPGKCPQWYRDGTGFYYFLDVGYDGNRAELWSASADGEARLRVTRSDYFIARGPVVISPDNRSLAFFYETSRASGDFQDVVVVDVRPSPAKSTDGRVVFRTKDQVEPQTLTWTAIGRLSVVVQGIRRDIDATVVGRPQDP